MPLALWAVLASCTAVLAGNFSLVKEYSGNDFFSDWDFYGHYDDLNSGNVIFVNQSDSASLAYINSAGRAVIKVDDTTAVPLNYPRNSVRITTKDYLEIGTIWVIDSVHVPFGCSVWPSIWTKGDDWPNQGEIDIIEGVNLMDYNQMAVHTRAGCSHATGTDETGQALIADCSPASGCTVKENKPASYGQDLANIGGGVWAAQFGVSGVFIWFWTRGSIPPSITTATDSIDISGWGPPSAAFPTGPSCNTSSFFGAQQLVIDVTLCGQWAGVKSVYGDTCGNSTDNACYLNNVVGSGANYANAYFEINYIRAFALSQDVVYTPTQNASSSAAPATGATSPGNPSPTAPSGGSVTGGAGNALGPYGLLWAVWGLCMTVVGLMS